MIKQVLTIAGSDSGAGAGIQADLKAFAANEVYGLSVITAITAQNTLGVNKFSEVSIDMISAQIDAVFEDFNIAAIKTGMLPSSEIINLIVNKLKDKDVPLIVDTVMIAKGGSSLMNNSAVSTMVESLIPLANLITPNIDEAEFMLERKIKTVEEMKSAATNLHAFGCKAVLLKGGHLDSDKAIDVLFDGNSFSLFETTRIPSENTHGTGCTLASTITANIAKEQSLENAISNAKEYITGAIEYTANRKIGHGHGPLDHFYKNKM